MNNRPLLFAFVIASLAQAALFDLSMLLEWSWETQRIVLWIALGLDIVFVLDFLFHVYFSVLRTQGMRYIVRGRGWIDFLSSVVPLCLVSGPIALSISSADTLPSSATLLGYTLFAAGFLRYLRVVKLFDAIAYPKSPMAQRHVSSSVTAAVAIVVLLASIGFVSVLLLAEPLDLTGMRNAKVRGLAGISTGIAAVLLYLLLLPAIASRFARTVVDPIHLMEQGLSRKGYNVEVRVPEPLADDEVFRLATLYNETVLPVKDTIDRGRGAGISDLSGTAEGAGERSGSKS